MSFKEGSRQGMNVFVEPVACPQRIPAIMSLSRTLR